MGGQWQVSSCWYSLFHLVLSYCPAAISDVVKHTVAKGAGCPF